MIIVTGFPRMGTSLMMQTLMHLGVPVAGSKFMGMGSEENPPRMNPKGFYEDRNIVTKLADGAYEGKAVKIFLKQFDFVEYFLGKKWIDILEQSKIILCLRDFYVSEVSMLLSGTMPVDHTRIPKMLENKMRLVQIIMSFLEKNKSTFDKMYRVHYESFVGYPEDNILNLIKFLELEPNEDQIKGAIANVEPRLMRTSMYYLKRDLTEHGLVVCEAVENLGKGILDFSKIGRP
jgi:hypothetical protein